MQPADPPHGQTQLSPPSQSHLRPGYLICWQQVHLESAESCLGGACAGARPGELGAPAMPSQLVALYNSIRYNCVRVNLSKSLH